MSKKQKYFLLTTLTVLCGAIVYFQYQNQKEKHDRLLKFGLNASLESKHYNSSGVDYVHYYFVTKSGQKIEGNEKCGKDFSKYTHATTIYNPKNPSEYELSFNFEEYSFVGRFLFFFFVYLPIMIFITYKFINIGLSIYLKIKS